MDLNLVREEDIFIVYASGEFVYTDVSRFETELKEICTELIEQDLDMPLPILVDMRLISFIDSAAVAALIGLHLECRHRLIEVGYSSFIPRVMDILERTNVTQMISCFETEQEGRSAMIERERIFHRFPFHTPAKIIGEKTFFQVNVLNISMGGALLYSHWVVPSNTKFRLILEENHFETEISTIRCNPFPEGYEVGTVFVNKEDSFQEKLVELMVSLQKPKASPAQ